MKLFSYTCPECDAYTRKIEGRKTTDGIQVQCPECGFVEKIGRNARIGRRPEVMAR